MPVTGDFGLAQQPDSEGDGELLAVAALQNGSILYEMFSPNVYLAHNRSDYPLGISLSTFGQVHTSWHGDIIFHQSSGPIKRFDVAAETYSDLIPAINVSNVTTMRVDTQDRIVTAYINTARRYNPDLSIDTTVTLSPPAGGVAPQVVAIAPDGDTIYGVRTNGDIKLYQWSIDGGGGAASSTVVRTVTGDRGFSHVGLGVHDDGSVMMFFEQIDGTGNFLSDPYTHRVYFMGGGSVYEVTSQMPNPEAGLSNPRTSDYIAIQPGGSDVVTQVMDWDTYGGKKYGYCPFFYNPAGLPDSWYVARFDIESGTVDLLSPHPVDNSLGNRMAGGGSNVMIYRGTPAFPAFARYPAKDAPATWGPPTS